MKMKTDYCYYNNKWSAKVVFLLVALCLVTCNESEELERYTEQILIYGKWGSQAGQSGWSKLEDGIVYGPASFAVDAGGNIWIADVLNNRLEKFDSTGGYITEFVPEEPRDINDITVGMEGKLYVFYCEPRILVYDSLGKFLSGFIIGKRGGILGWIEVDDAGNIFVQDPDVSDHFLKLSSEGEVLTGVMDRAYWVETKGNYYIREWYSALVSKFEDYVSNARGDTVWLWRKNIQPSNFYGIIGIDRDKNFYVHASTNERDFGCIIKISPEGKLLAAFKIRWAYTGPELRPIRIDSRGNVYVLGADLEDSTFTLWKYERTKQ